MTIEGLKKEKKAPASWENMPLLVNREKGSSMGGSKKKPYRALLEECAPPLTETEEEILVALGETRRNSPGLLS